MENPYDILELPKNSSIDIVKKKFKKLALQYHPDKLQKFDDNEKEIRIEKFKKISEAYGKIINGDIDYNLNDDLFTPEVWKETWDYIFNSGDTKDILKDTFLDIASTLLKKNIKPKSFYKPSTNYIKHNIILPVSYNEVYSNIKRKLRLVLTNISDPIFIDIHCNNYPTITKYFIDDDENEHEIIINLELTENDKFTHIVKDDNSIDLITVENISLKEFIKGSNKKIEYIDNSSIDIDIPYFENIVIKHGFGINNGDLIINLIVKNIENTEWKKISAEDRTVMIRILDAI